MSSQDYREGYQSGHHDARHGIANPSYVNPDTATAQAVTDDFKGLAAKNYEARKNKLMSDQLGVIAKGYAQTSPGEQQSHTAQGLFFMDVATELLKARDKFPSSLACTVALTEEVGELAKAMLDESPERIYHEAVQVAAMAVRCALEGDPSLDLYRSFHQGVGAVAARGKRP